MTDQLQHLEMIFPDLAAAGYNPQSEEAAVYSRIAYAAGDETRKWAGYREVGFVIVTAPIDVIEEHKAAGLPGRPRQNSQRSRLIVKRMEGVEKADEVELAADHQGGLADIAGMELDRWFDRFLLLLSKFKRCQKIQ